MSNSYIKLRKFDKALIYLKIANKQYPDNLIVHFNILLALYCKRDIIKARQKFKRVKELVAYSTYK